MTDEKVPRPRPIVKITTTPGLEDDEVLSCVMQSLAVAPLLDIASDMDIQDLLTSMKQLLMQFYEDTVSREAIQVPLLTFNRIDPTVIPLKTLTITFSDLWNTPDIDRVKLLDKFFEILPTFESFRENFAYYYDVLEFLGMLLDKIIEDLNSYKIGEEITNIKLQDYLLNIFYITLEQDWELLKKKWSINFYMIEKQLVYLIAAHSQLKLSNSDVTLKQIVKTITQAYPKIDFNILLELGKDFRLKWKKEKRNEMVRSLLFDPELHTGSILEKILLDIIIPLGDDINKLHTPRYAFYWLMSHTKFPYIGIHLTKLAPPCLQLISSSHDENKVLALKCFNLIIENIGRSEMKVNNFDHVICEEIMKLIKHPSLEVLELSIPCSLSLMNLMTDPPHKLQELWKPNSFDMYLLSYLEYAAYETKSNRKQLYVKYLERIIQTCRQAIIKHLKSIVTLLIEYMKVKDVKEVRLSCLKCLKLLLVHGWPRICTHSIDILMSCVNVIAESHSEGNKTVYNETRDFVLALRTLCNGSLDKHLECLKSFNNKGVTEMVAYVFEKNPSSSS